MRGTPLTSSGAICVPSSDLHGRPASAAACRTTSDLPTPGGDSSSTLCSCARQRMSFRLAQRYGFLQGAGLAHGHLSNCQAEPDRQKADKLS